MSVWTWVIVIGTVAAVVALGLMMRTRKHAAELSEQEGEPPRQGRHVVERPAGPDAESMDARASDSRSGGPPAEPGST